MHDVGISKLVPMDRYMADDLFRWRKFCAYPKGEDWVFASPTHEGQATVLAYNLMKRYFKPTARELGINTDISWHTFRHSFGALLKANGEDVKTAQELLRHVNSRITLDVYTQATTINKRRTEQNCKDDFPNPGKKKGVEHPKISI